MLLSDPLASQMLPRLGWTFAGLFGGSLVALVLSVRGHVLALRQSVLFHRWRTWLIIAPVFSAAALTGPAAVAAFTAVLAIQACREYASLIGLRPGERAILIAAAVTIPLAALTLPLDHFLAVAVAIPLLASLPSLFEQDVERGLERLTRLAFGVWYVPINLSLMVLIASDPRRGGALLLSLALGVALSDVGAFTAGRLWGKRPLAALLSPAKTMAGVGGNILGAGLGVALLAPDLGWLAFAPVVAVGAVWGDLLESLLKRAAGAKDTGRWLPGFGGLLDRIDSLLIVLPLAFLVSRVLL